MTPVLALAALLLAADAGAGLSADPNGPSCVLSGEVLQAYGIGTPWAELARMAQDVGAAPLRPDLFQRPGDRAAPLCADGPALPLGRKEAALAPGVLSLEWVPAMLSVYANSAYPSGANDGAVWQGKGISAQLGVGLQFQWGILSAAFVPGVAWQQNAAFPMIPTGLPGNLAYSNPYYGAALDVPQRFGDANYWTLTPGQSYVQLAYAGVGIGVSTENLWWGPGMRNTLLMSNNADGFPHAYVGTVRPVDVWIGNLEANLWLGSMGRSDYFYTKDRAWFFAFTADLELRWVRGLYVGFVLVNVTPSLCRSCEADMNQLAGFYGRWVFPPAGLEIYGEWTKEDSPSDYSDLVKELDHSVGYTLGLQKVFLGSDYWVRLIGEISDDNVPRPSRDWRPNPTAYYVHGGNMGYTNRGQIMGSAIGPGGSTQYLGVDVLAPSGWYGGWLERTRRNDVAYMAHGGPAGENDVEVGGGLRYVKSLGAFDLGALAGLAWRGSHDGLAAAMNVHGELQLTWWPGRLLGASP